MQNTMKTDEIVTEMICTHKKHSHPLKDRHKCLTIVQNAITGSLLRNCNKVSLERQRDRKILL